MQYDQKCLRRIRIPALLTASLCLSVCLYPQNNSRTAEWISMQIVVEEYN